MKKNDDFVDGILPAIESPNLRMIAVQRRLQEGMISAFQRWGSRLVFDSENDMAIDSEIALDVAIYEFVFEGGEMAKVETNFKAYIKAHLYTEHPAPAPGQGELLDTSHAD